MSTRKLHWGILGTGNIARQFSNGVNHSQRGVLSAVGSRTAESANTFAETHNIPSAYPSYQTILDDPQVDAIYNSLPNSMHHEWTIKALRAGKHVLCEKPIASNFAQAQEMFDTAQQCGKLLVEAFMYRSQPLTQEILKQIHSGTIGTVKLIRTSFCYLTRKIDGNIRFDPALDGGAMMDIGCYCIDLARLITASEPTEIRAFGNMHERGVDDLAVGILRFANDVLATFSCGMQVQADNTASICGDKGFIEIPVPWKPPAQNAAYVVGYSTPPQMDQQKGTAAIPPPRQTRTVSSGVDLYGLEADDFAAAALDGQPPRLSASDSLGNMRVLDEVLAQLKAAH